MIPKQLKNFNFVLLGGDDGKKPFEKGWHKKIHKLDCPILKKHLKDGKNYGVQSNNSFVIINKETHFLIIIDFDRKDFQDKVIKQFPETFTTTSGSPKQCFHLWFATDNNKSFKIKDEKLNSLADVLGSGNQVVAPGSKHIKSGSIYSVVKDVPISFMSYSEIEAILKPHDKTPKKIKKPKKQYTPKGIENNITEKILGSISMKSILDELGIDTSKNPTECHAHSSIGGKCLGWDDVTAHCFHCDNSWNKFSLVRDSKHLTDKKTFEWFAEKAGMLDELNQSRKEFVKRNKDMTDASTLFTDKLQIAELFYQHQPFFYDKSKLWWFWNLNEYKWELIDETDILNLIGNSNNRIDTIDSKEKNEIIESLKQVGRTKIPKAVNPLWIQFKNRIFDIKTGENFEASPKYFVTNPIPWKIHKNNYEQTPKMDEIFEEWVGKDYVKTLYEIIAYCLIPSYPIHRLFCFVGGGMNGKSKFLELLRKFVGKSNCCSTELDTLIQSRFEITRLHKKLVCQMGETNFNEMNKTSIIKKLTGGDLIGYEYKNKNPFEEHNYAKILIATNNLPTTTDKTIGFYRRWLIIDFPNQFSEKKDILEEVPEEEYESLALKCIGVLNDVLKKRSFYNEGSIEVRMEKYEAKADFLQKFLDEFTKEKIGEIISKAEFHKKFRGWCKENRHREMAENTLGKKMKEKNIETGQKYAEWLYDGKGGQMRVWLDLQWK